jgi:hypothetical protein
MFKRFTPILLLVCALGIFSASAQAETQGPVWKLMAVSNPTNFKPGVAPGFDSIVVMAINVGGASTDGSPITISDSLPAGLTATEVKENGGLGNLFGITGLDTYRKPLSFYVKGPLVNSNMQCSSTLTRVPSCTESNRVDPGDTLILTIPVSVGSASPVEPNVATVSGGGAASASVSTPVTVSSVLPAYGVAPGGLLAASSTSQAGAHPNVTTAFFMNTINKLNDNHEEFLGGTIPAGEPKDVGFDLPPGLVGTTVGMPRCTMADVSNDAECPRDTMVGTSTVIFYQTSFTRVELTVPVFNIAPAPGEPAAFAFNALYFPVRLDTSVLSDGDYGVRVTAPDINQAASVVASSITIWGVPADHSGPGPDRAHVSTTNYQENEYGPGETKGWLPFGGPAVEENQNIESKVQVQTRVPLLTNPSQCSESLKGILSTDSWQAPGVFAEQSTSIGTGTGCNLLSFKPGVSMLPDTLEAGAPAGYSFDLNVPQNTEPEGLATPDVKRTSVTLPEGTVISPSAADGLGDCSDEQFALHSGVPGGCPRDSQVGTVRIKTPALEERLTGDVYLAAPLCTGAGGTCSPQDAADGHMIRLFVQVVGEGESGIVVKLEGTGSINQQTGQITTTFNETPQLPFSEFQLTLQGGERATLANPRTCGEVTTTADLTPWSTPYTPDATPTSTFDVNENCFGAQFHPSFAADTTSDRAGEFSPFTLSFGRSDSDQFLNGLQVRMPPGLLGMISKVSLCGEAQANAGTCGPASLIGEASVQTGPGADPFLVTGGKVYITGPYKGAPYGLSIVVPAVAGPYTLSGTTGNGTVVNRSAINVNPETAALTVTADPLPTELDGIPLQLRLVNVTINRPEFTFNPTNCDQLAISGTMTSTEAASAHVSSPFKVLDCAKLAFKPKFTVSTSGKTSKAKGASLDAKLTYPNVAQGAEADIAKVKVDLPKQLPSRLTTLQKACTAQTFDANPANCPAASVIGTARVSTPVLPVQLTGPVYFVSHGGEAFPSLTVVLQGDGVRVDLVGATFISKAGITSTTFKTVPDTPFSSFELYLPEGKYSALAANGNLCKSSLAMPTAFTAQNGAEIHESTKIGVTGCPKAKKATKKRAKKASKARKSSHGQGGKS